MKWNLYSQSELFRLTFIQNETNDWSEFFFTAAVVLDFDNFMEYRKKLISFHLNLADNFENFKL
jgi:hypothetical protein